MLTLLLSTDWKANTDAVVQRLCADISGHKSNRILMVPELASHEMERRLCAAAGDTVSRFAEVLSFTRLSRRVAEYTGNSAEKYLDNGGRVVAMASAARQLHSKLKAYAALETRPEFLMGLVEAVDEFKRCCITSNDLKAASLQTEGNLAQKLEELSLIMEAYDGICAQGYRDPRDQMSLLLEQLEDSDFAANHVFYFTGFPDFSRQNLAIVEHVIANAAEVVISLNCDEPGSSKMAFEKAGETALILLRCAKQRNVDVKMLQIPFYENELTPVYQSLLQGRLSVFDQPKHLIVRQAESIYQECNAAAERVIYLVQNGCRYRDIRVICGDMGIYKHAVDMVFHRAGIPIYQSGTEEIMQKTVIHTVLSAMDAALSGFEQRYVIRYLKSMLSPISPDICDQMENYAILWSIDGRKWTEYWENHPVGLGEQWTDWARALIDRLNDARKTAIDPLAELRAGFQNAVNVKQQVLALYHFFERIHLSRRLQLLSEKFDEAGDNRSAQIMNQLWEILLGALEQLYDMLGNTAWDAENFTRLFKLLLSQYDVGTIPSMLDAVSVGPVSAMRCQQSDHLIVLGASEGSFPKYGGASGVLTDLERQELQKLDLPLNSGSIDGLQTEFSEIYDVFCGTGKSIYVSYPSGQPSYLYDRLKTMAGEKSLQGVLGAVLTDKTEASAYLVRNNAEAEASALGLTDDYRRVYSSTLYQLGDVEPEHIRQLYGQELRLSASQVDRLAECRLSYFLKYGMRAKERKAAQIDPAEFGTYVHAVLEACGRKIVDSGGFHNVSLDDTLMIAADASARYFSERFHEIDSQRLSYHFERNRREVMLIVEELWKEMQQSKFQAVDFEVPFGDGETMDAIEISGTTMQAKLGGFVDRVDSWQDGSRNYFRIVDYKTGAKDFDYCDVFNGIGLQMLLYLYALEDSGEAVLGDAPIPAGVQYFPARVPLINADGALADDEAEQERIRIWRRKGLLLQDENVLQAMEPGEKPVRLPYARKKDGTLSGDLASREQFGKLRRYIFMLLSSMVDEIACGKVSPNPYTRGASHNACTFCPYGPVCHPETVEDRRNYQAMKADRFWAEVEKEVHDHG